MFTSVNILAKLRARTLLHTLCSAPSHRAAGLKMKKYEETLIDSCYISKPIDSNLSNDKYQSDQSD